MRRLIPFPVLAAILAAAVAPGFARAAEAPGAAILTTGGAETRVSMGAGVRYADEGGVHVFRGAAPAAPAEAALLGAEPAAAGSCVETIVIEYPWRRLRRLRTQGFYSGIPYPSRPYTQGFYSQGR